MSRPTPVTAHTDWCEQNHDRDGTRRCVRKIGMIRGVHIYVSGEPGQPPQVLVDSNGALVRFEASDARVLHWLIGEAIRVAGGELMEVEEDPT